MGPFAVAGERLSLFKHQRDGRWLDKVLVHMGRNLIHDLITNRNHWVNILRCKDFFIENHDAIAGQDKAETAINLSHQILHHAWVQDIMSKFEIVGLDLPSPIEVIGFKLNVLSPKEFGELGPKTFAGDGQDRCL